MKQSGDQGVQEPDDLSLGVVRALQDLKQAAFRANQSGSQRMSRFTRLTLYR